MKTPRILLIGTGAVGGLYGTMLQRAGCHLETVCRSDLAAVRDGGIRVQSVWGDFTCRPEAIHARVEDVPVPPDFVIVALKVLPEIDLSALLRPVIGPETAIVLLQNGVDIEPPIAAAFPENEIISGLAFVCANRVGPGIVHHLDYGRLTIGLYPGGDSDRVHQLHDCLTRAGVPCTLSLDVRAARWQKLVWNAPFNPLSVLAEANTQEILDCPQTAALAEQIMHEVVELAAAEGAHLPDSIAADMLAYTRQMQPYKTSMLLDHQAGRPMEVEAILGNAVRVADRHDLQVPGMRTIYALLKLVDQRNRQAP